MYCSVKYNPMPSVYGDSFYHIDEMVDSTVGAEIRRGKELQNQKKKLKKSRIVSKNYSFYNDGTNSFKSNIIRKPGSYSQKISESIQRLTQPVKRYPKPASTSNKVISPSQKTNEKWHSQKTAPSFTLVEKSQSFQNKPVRKQTTKNIVTLPHEKRKKFDNVHKNQRTRQKCQNEGKKNEKEATYARSFCIMFAHRVAEELLPPYQVNLFGRLRYLSSVLKEEICNMTAGERNPKKDKNLELLRKNLVDEIAKRTAIWINVVMEEAFSRLAEDELRDLEEQVGPVFEFLDDLIENVEDQIPSDEEILLREKFDWASKQDKTLSTITISSTDDSMLHNIEDIHRKSYPLKDGQEVIYPSKDVVPEVKDTLENFINKLSDSLKDKTHETGSKLENHGTEVGDKLEHSAHESSKKQENYTIEHDRPEDIIHDIVNGNKLEEDDSEVGDRLVRFAYEVGNELKTFSIEIGNKAEHIIHEDDVLKNNGYELEKDLVEVGDKKVELDHEYLSEKQPNHGNLVENVDKLNNNAISSAIDDIVILAELIDGIVGADFEEKTNFKSADSIKYQDIKKENVIEFIDEVMNDLGMDEDILLQGKVSSDDITFGMASDSETKHEPKNMSLSNWYGNVVDTWRAEIDENNLQKKIDDVKDNIENTFNSKPVLGLADTKSALSQLKTVAMAQQNFVEISDFELNKITNFSEVAKVINQISSIHDTIPVESNMQGALEINLLKLIDAWCPENMDESMGQTINYVSGEVASWLDKKQMDEKKRKEIPLKNSAQNLTNSMHSINSYLQSEVSDESLIERGYSLVEDIQIPFRDSTPSTEEIRVFQIENFKSSSSVTKNIRECDSSSSKSSMATLKLELNVTSAFDELPTDQHKYVKEMNRDITEEIFRKQVRQSPETNKIENEAESRSTLSSDESRSSIRLRIGATNHGDTREVLLKEDTRSDECNDEWKYNRDVLAHILPDVLGVSDYKIDTQTVFEDNNYEKYRVPNNVSSCCLHGPKVECNPCHCNDDKKTTECIITSDSSSGFASPSKNYVIMRDWGQVLNQFSLDMLPWSQWINSTSIEVHDLHSQEETIFHKPNDFFKKNNKNDWMEFRELVEEEAAKRRKSFVDNAKCVASKHISSDIKHSEQNSVFKPTNSLPKCKEQENIVNVIGNTDKCNQWIHGKVLEHLLENQSQTAMEVADWKELKRSLQRDEEKWSQYRKRADKK